MFLCWAWWSTPLHAALWREAATHLQVKAMSTWSKLASEAWIAPERELGGADLVDLYFSREFRFIITFLSFLPFHLFPLYIQLRLSLSLLLNSVMTPETRAQQSLPERETKGIQSF